LREFLEEERDDFVADKVNYANDGNAICSIALAFLPQYDVTLLFSIIYSELKLILKVN
jgi:hypothetical protein